MSLSIGDINIANDIIDIRYQLIRTQLLLEKIVNKNKATLSLPTKEEMEDLEKRTLQELKKKYPNMINTK